MPLKVFLFYVAGSFPAVLFVLKYAFIFVFSNSFNGVCVFLILRECGFYVANVSIYYCGESSGYCMCALVIFCILKEQV